MLLSGCVSGIPPDYISSNGVEYYLHDAGWDPKDIELQENFFLNNISQVPGYSKSKLDISQVWVEVKPDAFICTEQRILCNGTSDVYLRQELYIRNMGCPFNSATSHEMAHYLQYFIFNINDYNHTDFNIWSIADLPAGTCEKP